MQDSIREITLQQTDELTAKFEQQCQSKIAEDRLHWVDVQQDPDRAVSNFSRMFDITVLGQYRH